MSEPALDRPTADDVVQFPSTLAGLSQTQTMQQRASNLASQIAYVRAQNAALANDIADSHHRSFRVQLDIRVSELVQRDPKELLAVLAGQGFGWNDVARMLGVSIPTLRRWRTGERPTGPHRRAIAQLVAFVQILRDDRLVFDPASWLEVPIVDEAPINGVDLYAEGRLDALFDLATGNLTPDAALDESYPDWRERYRSEWEVGLADDGLPSIRRREDRWR